MRVPPHTYSHGEVTSPLQLATAAKEKPAQITHRVDPQRQFGQLQVAYDNGHEHGRYHPEKYGHYGLHDGCHVRRNVQIRIQRQKEEQRNDSQRVGIHGITWSEDRPITSRCREQRRNVSNVRTGHAVLVNDRHTNGNALGIGPRLVEYGLQTRCHVEEHEREYAHAHGLKSGGRPRESEHGEHALHGAYGQREHGQRENPPHLHDPGTVVTYIRRNEELWWR